MQNKLISKIEDVIISFNKGNVIAYPTESIFGIGCDPDNEKAVNKLLELKQRSWKKGLILIADNYEKFENYIDDNQLNNKQKQAIFSSWPGPVTWIIPANTLTPKWLTGHFNTLAVRVTNHTLARLLCRKYGKPIVSTSANLSGQIPCRTTLEVIEKLKGNLLVFDGLVNGHLNPSEIRDSRTGQIYRKG
ncbi:Threonylcarbamoyl-AMP synthase [Candidatus Hartigia pinicola]|nr:Threonylcarbamoyl-AMP synthase [Candidatus Hartigia pinicola]